MTQTWLIRTFHPLVVVIGLRLETLCFEQLKLKVCILIFVCLFLRKYSVNAHCDLNMIISCPKGRTASIGHHSWHTFPRIRKPKPMSIYFFTGRETCSFLLRLSWSPKCSHTSPAPLVSSDGWRLILWDLWFSPVLQWHQLGTC